MSESECFSLLVSSLKSPLHPGEEGSVKCVSLHTAIEELSEMTGSDVLCGTDTDWLPWVAACRDWCALIPPWWTHPHRKSAHKKWRFVHRPSTYWSLHHLLVCVTWCPTPKVCFSEGTGTFGMCVFYLFTFRTVGGRYDGHTVATYVWKNWPKIPPPRPEIQQ